MNALTIGRDQDLNRNAVAFEFSGVHGRWGTPVG
jgi:hypothetical protein